MQFLCELNLEVKSDDNEELFWVVGRSERI